MVRYLIYDKDVVQKKGLDKGFLRSVPTKRDADVYVSNCPPCYIIKKVSNKQYKEMLKKRR